MDEIFLANPSLGEQEKVVTTSTYLEAEAYDWFLWWSSKCTGCSFNWQNLKSALLKRFHDEEENDVYERFVHLKQKGSLSEYTHEWEVFIVRQRRFSNEKLLKMYRCGFKDCIREELKLHKPKTIKEAKHGAIIIERKYKLHKTPYVTNDRTNSQFKGKATKQEEEPSEDSSDKEENEENENPSPKSEDEMPRISIAAIIRIAQPQTLKLKGYIKNQSVIVMVDSGSTHNFVDANVAKRLNIFAYTVTDLKVMVADGKQIDGVGKCHKIKLQLSDYAIESSFYTVPLGGVDVALGVQWLRTLGTYSANHIKQFIKFKCDGRKYQLFGFQAPPTQVISTQQMKKLICKGAPAFVAQCQHLELLSTEGTHQTSEIPSLIQRYEKVFQDLPMKLPPERQIEHIIKVKTDSTPVNVKPYHYPHHHKTEIECLIQDLLKHGIITESRSPYTAPVVLVKKKDKSFQLCIDYKGLNKITIKHKFPIPFIDEMLDELHGVEYFSKLDLRSSYYQIRVRLEDI
eukprot:PITA_30836